MNWLPENDNGCRRGEYYENLEILRQIDFFSGLDLDVLKILAYLSCRRLYRSGDFIFRRNDDDGQALYLLTGHLQLLDDEHPLLPMIRKYGAGCFLGGLSLLGSMPRLFSLKAVSDCECLTLTREKFAKALEQYPQMMPTVIKKIIERIRAWEQNCLMHTIDREKIQTHCVGVSLL